MLGGGGRGGSAGLGIGLLYSRGMLFWGCSSVAWVSDWGEFGSGGWLLTSRYASQVSSTRVA